MMKTIKDPKSPGDLILDGPNSLISDSLIRKASINFKHRTLEHFYLFSPKVALEVLKEYKKRLYTYIKKELSFYYRYNYPSKKDTRIELLIQKPCFYEDILPIFTSLEILDKKQIFFTIKEDKNSLYGFSIKINQNDFIQEPFPFEKDGYSYNICMQKINKNN